MNRADLDAFFANAEDVLTDWQPDCDAMVATVPTSDDASLPQRADSYYEQHDDELDSGVLVRLTIDTSAWDEAIERVGAALLPAVENITRWLRAEMVSPPTRAEVMAALDLNQTTRGLAGDLLSYRTGWSP